jgi:hypothetical protein
MGISYIHLRAHTLFRTHTHTHSLKKKKMFSSRLMLGHTPTKGLLSCLSSSNCLAHFPGSTYTAGVVKRVGSRKTRSEPGRRSIRRIKRRSRWKIETRIDGWWSGIHAKLKEAGRLLRRSSGGRSSSRPTKIETR